MIKLNNNIDMNQLLKMVSKMDKNQLQDAIAKANQIMNSKDKDKIIDDLKKNMK